MKIDHAAVVAAARAEIQREQFQLAVAAEKARQLAPKKSLWQRLTQWLPFTITITRKEKS